MKIYYSESEVPDHVPLLTNCEPQILLKQLVENANKNGANVRVSFFRSVVILDESYIDDIKEDVDKWIRENVEKPCAIVLSPETFRYHFFFMGEADAMAFKLMWMD